MCHLFTFFNGFRVARECEKEEEIERRKKGLSLFCLPTSNISNACVW
jgi:hypothetical protein